VTDHSAEVGAVRRTGVPPDLSESLIVAAAVALIEQDGFEGFSMRKLAAVLDVTATALYRYVPTRQHLLDLVADRYFAEIDLLDDDADWKAFLTDFLRSVHRLLLEQPMFAEVLIRQPVDGLTALRLSNTIIGRLRQAGFEGRVAVEILTNLASFVIGFTLHQIGRVGADPEERATRLREADAGQYPHLAALADDWVRWSVEANFESGLGRLLDSYDTHPRGGST
jgi:TetR/AcrR family transcriptional regulator, tetracycline repressor protein